jgi:hypothetical protein
MPELEFAQVECYLSSLLGKRVKVLGLAQLGDSANGKRVKGYGYGTPVQVDYQADHEMHRAVLHTISPGPFGHEHKADRAQILLWESRAFNLLPRHVRSLDVGGFQSGGNLDFPGQGGGVLPVDGVY